MPALALRPFVTLVVPAIPKAFCVHSYRCSNSASCTLVGPPASAFMRACSTSHHESARAAVPKLQARHESTAAAANIDRCIWFASWMLSEGKMALPITY